MIKTCRVWAVITLLLVSTSLYAEDTRKKWQIGGGISYWSTMDDIRSNSTTAFAPPNPTQQNFLAPIFYTDPRPDANELNQPTIQDNWKLDLNASFGVTRFFALELSGSYFKGPVGNVEFYSEDRFFTPSLTQIPEDPGNPSTIGCNAIECYQMKTASDPNRVIRNGFLPVGQITEVPVQLTGVVRFRPESPFDPYVGGGVGYIFTSLDTSNSDIGTPVTISASTTAGDSRVVTMRNFDDVADYTNGLMVTSILSGARGVMSYPCKQTSFYPVECQLVQPQGGIPIHALEASVDSAPEFHLVGGVDYYFTSHLSMYIDGRYLWAQSKVEVRINGENQISAGIKDYGCQSGGPSCRISDGTIKDTSNARIVNDTIDDVADVILIQGGDIRLGGFSLGVGFKYTF